MTRAGLIDTWDYPWIYTVIEQGGLACCPTRNMISNLGFGFNATRTNSSPDYDHLSNRPPAKIEFPLSHPTSFVRSAALEQVIETVRLNLHPPLNPGLLRRVAAAARRRIGRLKAFLLEQSAA
jgi:hypothetical protein